jgi:hypothetical protein
MGETCDNCGDTLYHGPPDCPRCGAPNCCQRCCKEAEMEAVAENVTRDRDTWKKCYEEVRGALDELRRIRRDALVHPGECSDCGSPEPVVCAECLRRLVEQRENCVKERLTVREACRRRLLLGGADTQALEHALTITEQERDEAKAEVASIRANEVASAAFATDQAEKLAQLKVDFIHAVEDEREACAAVCDSRSNNRANVFESIEARKCGAMIRSRGSR